MTQEAYRFYKTPVNSITLENFLLIKFFNNISQILCRPLTIEELRLFLDFERDENDKPKMYHCKCCGAGFPAVKWLKVSFEKFYEHLEQTMDIRESLSYFQQGKMVDEYGVHFPNPDDPMKEPWSYCGPAFPDRIIKDGIFKGYKPSCLKGIVSRSGRDDLFGLPMSEIEEIRKDILEEERRNAEATAKAAQEAEKERLAKETVERERQKKLDQDANRLFAGRNKV